MDRHTYDAIHTSMWDKTLIYDHIFRGYMTAVIESGVTPLKSVRHTQRRVQPDQCYFTV